MISQLLTTLNPVLLLIDSCLNKNKFIMKQIFERLAQKPSYDKINFKSNYSELSELGL